jgi:8-oxo-dGTP pyrophosphatase MutT (NUDIX family)
MAIRHQLLENTSRFLTHTTEILGQNITDLDGRHVASPTASSVLFLISEPCSFGKHSKTPWLVLNKRSRQVSQPGDLCFPGGGPSPRVDTMLAKSLSLPGFPFSRWRSRVGYPFSKNSHLLAQLLATCLRESFEEMRLIPLAVKFLGPLPSQRLVMFDRVIYPMVGWVKYQKYFRLNGEVESLGHIPI